MSIAACVSPLTFTQVHAGMKEPFEKTRIPAFAGMTKFHGNEKLLVSCYSANPAYYLLYTGLRRHDGGIHTIKASSNIAITANHQQYL